MITEEFGETQAPAWRLFASLAVSDDVRQQMLAIREALTPQGWNVRWVDPSLAHLTLKFFGNTPPDHVDELRLALSEVATFSRAVPLQTGEFLLLGPRRNPNVLSLEIVELGEPGQLEQLAQAIEVATGGVGAGGNQREFKAHLTLGRFKGKDGAPADAAAILQSTPRLPAEWRGETLELVRSVLSQDGPTYTTLAQWQLEHG